jgi:sortase A
MTHTMYPKIIGISLAALLCASTFLFYGDAISPARDAAETPTITNEVMSAGLPVRIMIPEIAVNTSLEQVGLTDSGEMGTPSEIQNVGWYALGSRPGETGTAVIAGHYGWKGGKVSAFDDLHKLKIGDRISVLDDAGNTYSFLVSGSKIYDRNADASDVFTSNDDLSHLNLITCHGEWDEATENYTERLVIFAVRE